MKTTSISIWYRRWASGVRTTLRNMCGTGDGPLGYELLSGTCVVQERGLWGTNYSRNMCGTGEGPLGYELLSETCPVQEKGLWGTNRTRNVFGTGEGPLMYGMLHKTPLV